MVERLNDRLRALLSRGCLSSGTRTRSILSRAGFIAFLAVSFSPLLAWAADVAPGALAHLVEADAALFVEVRQFQEVVKAWPETELGRRWERSWFGTDFPPLKAVRGVEEQIRAATNQSLIAHLTEFFGQSTTLALYLPDNGPPEGVLLVQAASPEAIERGLALWNRLEPEAQTTRRERSGFSYFARQGRGDTVYYTQLGARFVLSDREERVVAAAQRLAKPAGASLADDPAFRATLASVDAETIAWSYAPARRWDRVLHRDADDSPLSQRLLAGWSAVDALQLTVHLKHGLHVDLQARLGAERLPREWSAATTPSGLPALCRQAPADALVVAGVRLQPAWWMGQILTITNAANNNDWQRTERILRGLLQGESPLGDLASSLLRDCGGYLLHETVRTSVRGEPRRLPWSIVWNATFSDNDDRNTRHAAALENALLFGLNGVAAHLNSKGDQPLRVVESRGQLHWLTGDPLWEPSFLVTPRGLLVGTSAAVVNQATAILDQGTTTETPFLRTADGQFDDAAIFAWANLARLRELPEYRALSLAARATGSAGEKGVAVLELSRLFDSASLRGHYANATLRIVFDAHISE